MWKCMSRFSALYKVLMPFNIHAIVLLLLYLIKIPRIVHLMIVFYPELLLEFQDISRSMVHYDFVLNCYWNSKKCQLYTGIQTFPLYIILFIWFIFF